jgi:hypothetical protein
LPDATCSRPGAALPLMMAVLPPEWKPGTAVHVVLDSGHSALVTPPAGSKPGTNLLIPSKIVGVSRPDLGLHSRRRHPYSPGAASPGSLVVARRRQPEPMIEDAAAVQKATLAATSVAEAAIATASKVTMLRGPCLSTAAATAAAAAAATPNRPRATPDRGERGDMLEPSGPESSLGSGSGKSGEDALSDSDEGMDETEPGEKYMQGGFMQLKSRSAEQRRADYEQLVARKEKAYEEREALQEKAKLERAEKSKRGAREHAGE